MCIRDRKCVNVLKESCLFKNMEKRVRKILRVCEICQKSKVVNYRLEGELNYSICTILKVPVYKAFGVIFKVPVK